MTISDRRERDPLINQSALPGTVTITKVRNQLQKLFFRITCLLNDPVKSITIPDINTKLDELIEERKFRKKQAFRFAQLTPREKEVLHLLACGYTNKVIANLLSIRLETVKHHRKLIKSKLEVSSTADFIRYARAFDLF